MSPSLRQLQYFVTVAETGNLRRAAARLRVSQPTLTSQIGRLEGALAVHLFERSRAGSRLTPEGRDLLPVARGVLEQFRGLLDRAASMGHGPTGTYRLGVTPTLGPYLLPLVLPEIHRRFDALKFYVREGPPRVLEDDLSAGEHDLILTALPLGRGDLEVVPLFREPLRLVMSVEHRLAHRRRIRPEDLRGEPVLTLEEHHLLHRQIAGLCERLDARLLRDFEGTSLDTLRQMVVLGMGVAFLPALYVRSEIHEPETLHVATIEGEPIERTHALVWRRSSPAAGSFAAIAHEVATIARRDLSREIPHVYDVPAPGRAAGSPERLAN